MSCYYSSYQGRETREAVDRVKRDVRKLSERVDDLEEMIRGIAQLLCDPRSKEAQDFAQKISGTEKPVTRVQARVR